MTDEPIFSDDEDRCLVWAEHPFDERCHLKAPHPGFNHRRKSEPTFQWDDNGWIISKKEGDDPPKALSRSDAGTTGIRHDLSSL